MQNHNSGHGQVTRRQFISRAGGFTFAIAAGSLVPWIGHSGVDEIKDSNGQLTAWVHVSLDEKITIFNPASEMGQGSMTATVALFAEEMDIHWDQVVIKHAPIDPSIYGKPGGRGGKNMLNVGSSTIPGYYQIMRNAGAQARYVMLYNAAKKWSVDISELTTSPGKVNHLKSGRILSYGQVAAFATLPDQIPEIPSSAWKKKEEYRFIGKKIPRYDIIEKVDGSAKFSIDIVLPGMVYGVMSRSPVYKAKPNFLNEKSIRNLPGVIEVVVLNHGVGIVAETIEDALHAKKKLLIQWSEDVLGASHSSVAAYDEYVTRMEANEDGQVITQDGNVEDVFKEAELVISRDYKNDYAYHAQMEPLNAVISVAQDGKSVEAWVGSQNHPGAKAAVAKIVGVPLDRVKYHACYLGGGFGRRSMTGYVEEAAELGKRVKKPLKFIWTREDDVKYGAFRPMSLQRLKASLTSSGDIQGWWYGIVGTGGGLLASGARTSYYNLPNQRVEVRNIDHGIRTKHWRAVAHGPNKFAIEAFIDELAEISKQDPVKFRRKLLKDSPKALRVLDKAVQMSNWGVKTHPDRAKGISFIERSRSLVAGVAEISLNQDSGIIKVHRFWVAIDAGVVVQLDNAIAQTEGSIVMGLSNVMSESITFLNGEVQQSNYHDYQVMRMADAPEAIDIEFIDSDDAPTGLGEAGLPMVGGAVANAFAKLTGKRLYHMPFTPEKVLQVLQN